MNPPRSGALTPPSTSSSALPPVRPPLKWAGGKRWLVPHILPLWQRHTHRRLVEPMCGGIAVALGLSPTSVLLNDINPHTINFYRWLKRGLDIEEPMRNSRAFYVRSRERFNTLVRKEQANTREAAVLFYYLNRTCYNGLCRFNGSGDFNVPFGTYKTITYRRDFSDFRALFAGWKFTNVDFEKIALERRDFVYADPPYDVQFTRYAKEDFSWDDQVRLAEWLAGHRGPLLLSNQATTRIIRLYRKLGFRLKFFDAPRLISCNGNRTPAREVLAFRNL